MHYMSQDPAAREHVVDAASATTAIGPRPMTLAFRLATALWLAVVIGGAVILNLHARAPGKQGEAPARWPVASRIPRSTSGPTLLVFVHPHCPCSRTTLGELAAIMTACQGRVTAQVLFVAAEGENPNWAENELWQTAQAIPGVHPVVDTRAVEAARFGAQTSGLTLLFNEQGECLFSGGITASRGHAGDNIGRQAIVSCVANQRPETSRAPTFGCALFADESTISSEDAL